MGAVLAAMDSAPKELSAEDCTAGDELRLLMDEMQTNIGRTDPAPAVNESSSGEEKRLRKKGAA